MRSDGRNERINQLNVRIVVGGQEEGYAVCRLNACDNVGNQVISSSVSCKFLCVQRSIGYMCRGH